jgi:hypothetical protein
MTTTRTTTSVPTMTITGSGGIGTAANKITFNFNKGIKDGLFTVNDIGIVNGTIHSDSFTKVSATQYTIMVTPSLGGKHSNVAITVETSTLTGTANTLTDISDNGNTHTGKRPIFNGFIKIKCNFVSASAHTATACNPHGWHQCYCSCSSHDSLSVVVL